jgi:hypothetical protein
LVEKIEGESSSERGGSSLCAEEPWVTSPTIYVAPPTPSDLLTVASKVNPDGTIKQRLVIDLSRWVNKFISPDRYTMARFQDALALSSRGDYQSVFDVSKAYHHLRLAPESYDLVGFCVVGEDVKERFYHFVVVVFGLGPAGQALGRVMRPVLSFLSKMGIRNLMYVDDGFVVAATKDLADSNYAFTLRTFEEAGFTIAWEKSDKLGDSAQRKEICYRQEGNDCTRTSAQIRKGPGDSSRIFTQKAP